MKKQISTFEKIYLPIIIILLVTIPVVETYQHLQSFFHEREIQDDQRKRISRNYDFVISDADWEIYQNNIEDGSAVGQEVIYSKWRKERCERNR